MLKTILRSACVMFITLLACHEEETSPTPEDPCVTMSSANHGEVIDGEYIISLEKESQESGRNFSTAARVLSRNNIQSNTILEPIDGELSTHYVVRLTDDEVSRLRKDPSVKHLEPDRVISICACFTVLEPNLVTWNVDRVGYDDGTGKTAWILDTGIDFEHPDLIVDKTLSKSFVDGNTSGDDDNGHGTHIAGVIGAKNNDFGTLGVASGATLISLKILDSKGDGRLSAALKALTFVRANGKPGQVVNISLALGEISETLENEIRGVANQGIYVAIAAGNESQSTSSTSPARTAGKNIYTVSAVDSLNQFASFSNYGSEVDFAAPGVRVLSSYLNGKYAYISGTSMASPHVAGLLLINNGVVNSDGFAIDDPDGNPDPLAHQ